MKIVLIGNSHLHAIEAAANLPQQVPSSTSLTFLQLQQPRFQPYIPPAEKLEICSEAKHAIAELVRAADLVVSVVQGAEYHKLSLANHPHQKFDFFMNEKDHVEISDATTVVPRLALEFRLHVLTKAFRLTLREIRKSTPKHIPVIHLQSPAPVFDEDFIHASPGGLQAMIKAEGVSSPGFRQKMWSFSSEITKQFCEQNNVAFAPVPPESLDKNGFIKRQYYGNDPIHCNPDYGQLVTRSIVDNFTKYVANIAEN